MTGVLADINIQVHVEFLIELLKSEAWNELWRALDLHYATFADVGLDEEAPDAVVWELCQERGYVLITSNRNQKTADSLEATIRNRSTAESFPVLTLADSEMTESMRDEWRRRSYKPSSTLIRFAAPAGSSCRKPRQAKENFLRCLCCLLFKSFRQLPHSCSPAYLPQ